MTRWLDGERTAVGGGWGGGGWNGDDGGWDEDGDVRCRGDGLVVDDPRNRVEGRVRGWRRLRISGGAASGEGFGVQPAAGG